MGSENLKLGKYRHYKGGEYEVIGVARHSENQEEMVVYRSLKDGQIWARPFENFMEEVDIDGEKFPRFKFIGK